MTTLELIERGIGHNCLSDAYELGRADAIELIENLMNRYEHFTHDEYYISAVLSDLDDLAEQLKEKNK